jgi:CBS-domain-containing membrane protein
MDLPAAMISRSALFRALITALGGGLGIGVMVALASWADVPLAVVPFTTSIVLVMAAPESKQAQRVTSLAGMSFPPCVDSP